MKNLTLLSVSIFILSNIIHSQDIINETGKDGKFIVRDAEQQEFLIIENGNVEIRGTLSIDSLAQGTVDDRQVVWSTEDKQFKALYNLIPRSTINASTMAADSWTESGSDVYRASGNVGIGIATPIYPLTVYRSGANASVVTQRDGGAINYINATATHGTFGTVNNFPTRISQNAQIKMFIDASNNGIYFGSTGNVTSSTDDDIDVAIDSDGNVGIGTVTPDEKLHVAGNMRLDGTFEDKDGQAGTAGQILSSTATGTDWIAASSGGTSLWTESTGNIYRLTGNVGIGTTNPIDILNIYGGTGPGGITMQNDFTGAGVNDGLWVGHSNTKAYLWNSENKPLEFGTNNQSRMSISETGNVGIGTTNPSSKLYIVDSQGAASTTPILAINNTADSGQNMLDFQHSGLTRARLRSVSGAGLFIETKANSDIRLSTNNVLRMTIKNDGNVGIGTITPSANLHVSGDDGLLVQGTFGNGDVQSLGAGTRLHYYPKKSAFRVGTVDGDQWDDGYIGNNSTAIGTNSYASGDYSISLGYATSSYGQTSTAMGSITAATGDVSTTMGYRTQAASYASTALGRFNVGGGTADSWVSTDPLFEIGIGADADNKANAITVLKNGNVGIGTDAPSTPLTISGSDRDMIKLIPGGGQGRVHIASNIEYLDFIQTNTSETFMDYLNITAKNGEFSGYTTISGNATIAGSVGVGTLNPGSKLAVVGLLEYADNASAISAGLGVGDLYRTGDLLKIVH